MTFSFRGSPELRRACESSLLYRKKQTDLSKAGILIRSCLLYSQCIAGTRRIGEAARRSTASTAVSQGHVRSYLWIADYPYQRWRPCLATTCLQTCIPIDLTSCSHTAVYFHDTNLLYCPARARFEVEDGAVEGADAD